MLETEQDLPIKLLSAGEERKLELNKKDMPEGRYPIFISIKYQTSFGEEVNTEKTEFIQINDTIETQPVPQTETTTEETQTNQTSNETQKVATSIAKQEASIIREMIKEKLTSLKEKIKNKALYLIIGAAVVILFIATIIIIKRSKTSTAKPQKLKYN